MRIAFVGKGGSGKTTLSALMSQHLKGKAPLLVIDADLNIHLPALLGFEPIPKELHISHPQAAEFIKKHLWGENARIKELAHFRKTTPPGAGSGFISLHDPEDPVLKKYASGSPDFRIMAVGTYDTDDIGASCYHNNLSILENILSHLADHKGNLVCDMVAGVDAFANTLHAQFDLLVLAVEPTKRGMEVYEQYRSLAEDAGVGDVLYIVGNKVRSDADRNFIRKHVPEGRLLGFLGDSEYLRHKDQEGGALNISLLEDSNRAVLESISQKLFSSRPDSALRLRRLHDLHRRYVGQAFIKERFGDLTNQIDPLFDIQSLFQ